MVKQFDAAVVGAGIIGLAHAYHLARSGRSVVVFERNPRAMGASVRNFGMLWPIGQPAGPLHQLALRSLEIWHEVLRDSNLWFEATGSLHLAYHEDEAQILAEFAHESATAGYECQLLPSDRVLERSSAVNPDGLRAGLWSETETCVDPREVIAGLPGWLARQFGVHFEFGCAVTACDLPQIAAGGSDWQANHLFICTGDDLVTLFPNLLHNAGFMRCKLQMMRSLAYTDWRLGPMLAAGLTLQHYKAFAGCPTLAQLKVRFAAEMPQYARYGIHVMASQNGRGEIVIGDSHEYDDQIEPFDKAEIDALILRYLDTFLIAPDLRIASHWQGIYVKHPTEPYLVNHPAPGVTVVTGAGGAGMTLSFGLAEMVIREMMA